MMPPKPFKAHRIANQILDKLVKKKAQLARHDSLTAFIGWVLDLYADGQLEEAAVLRARIEAELLPEIEAKVRSEMTKTGKLIVAATAERIGKRNERKAS